MSTGMIASLAIVIFILARILPRVRAVFFSQRLNVPNYQFKIMEIFSLVLNFFFLLLQKSPFYVLLVGGWSFSVYAIQLVFRNLKPILQEHWHLAFGT
jgi:Mg2+/Co2+ transporter CorB